MKPKDFTSPHKPADKRDVYTRITDRIVEELEKGVVPWCQPWSSKKAKKYKKSWNDIWPRNGSSGHYYSGANVMMCWIHMAGLGLEFGKDPLFLTYEQAKRLGGHVRRGEKGCVVMAYSQHSKEVIDDETGEKNTEHYTGAYSHIVFHVSQCESVTLPTLQAEPATGLNEKQWSSFLDALGAKIEYGGTDAFYDWLRDAIRLPPAKSFDSKEDFKATALHEIGHWTGHKTRLDRKSKPIEFGPNVNKFTGMYAFEELVAELCSTFLCARLGIPHPTVRNAAYIQHWIIHFKNDKKYLTRAASAAGKAADYVLEKTKEVRNASAEHHPKGERRPNNRKKGPVARAGVPRNRRPSNRKATDDQHLRR